MAGISLGSRGNAVKSTRIRSNATPTRSETFFFFIRVVSSASEGSFSLLSSPPMCPSNTGAFGYLCEKCVKITR